MLHSSARCHWQRCLWCEQSAVPSHQRKVATHVQQLKMAADLTLEQSSFCLSVLQLIPSGRPSCIWGDRVELGGGMEGSQKRRGQRKRHREIKPEMFPDIVCKSSQNRVC